MQSVRNPQPPYSSHFAGYVPANMHIRTKRKEPSFTINGYAYSKIAKKPYIYLIGKNAHQELKISWDSSLALIGEWYIEGNSIRKWKIIHIHIVDESIRIYAWEINKKGKKRTINILTASKLSEDPNFWMGLISTFQHIRQCSSNSITLSKMLTGDLSVNN